MIERLLNFRESQDEPTTLTSLAESHRHLGLTAQDFEIFGKSFIASLEGVAKVDIATRDAWEAVLWPGIEYLKKHCVFTDETPNRGALSSHQDTTVPESDLVHVINHKYNRDEVAQTCAHG